MFEPTAEVNTMYRIGLVVILLSFAPPAFAQGSIVVVPWSAGAIDLVDVEAAADDVSLGIPGDAGSVLSVALTASRFDTTVSSDPPTVTSAELDEWMTYSRAAVRALADQDYTAAREALQRAQAISDRADAEMSREEAQARQVLDTCLYGVRAYVEQHDAHAEEQMLGCRRLVPHIAPSPNIHTPEVVDLMARVDQRLATAHRGPLSITSQPSGCTVRLNGIAVGQTPFTSEQLAPGDYRVQVECSGASGHGRLHHVSVPDAVDEVRLRIDARFDRIVRSDGVLRLAYADDEDANAHRVVDAVAIGRALAASEVWLVGVRPNGSLSGERVDVNEARVISSSQSSVGAQALVTALMTAPTSEVASDPRASSASHGQEVSGWVLLGVGSGVAIAGIVMVIVGFLDIASVENAADGSSYASLHAADDQAPFLTGVGFGALGVGVAAAAIGLGWALMSDQTGHRSASLRVGPGSISLGGTF